MDVLQNNFGIKVAYLSKKRKVKNLTLAGIFRANGFLPYLVFREKESQKWVLNIDIIKQRAKYL